MASSTAVAMKTRSANSFTPARRRGGSIAATTSMRICLSVQPTSALPRNTNPTIRKSMLSSAQGSDSARK